MLANYGDHRKKLRNDETVSRPKAAKRQMTYMNLNLNHRYKLPTYLCVWLGDTAGNLICFEESRPATALRKTPFQKLTGGRDVRQKWQCMEETQDS